ncbi:GAF and ANTAR domain-containing protein [Rhodococcus sp. 1168]|uniref:GAF and ANTAR domain-containing protein n=1 Tax=Rhodococcus sp. 1168 TaxID=2018041 RepID=UPI0015949010|nr:GAF and ANTAR domain-containing protein [Rhodococcus sp. 1168]
MTVDTHGPSRRDAGYRFASLAWDLAQHPGAGPTAQRVVDLAVTTMSCVGAAVTTLRANGRLRIIAASDRRTVAEAAEVADRTGQSATKAVLATKGTIVNNDVENDPRWAQYRELMTKQTSIRSTASFYLILGGVELGVMGFYSARKDFFTDEILYDCAIYADHAAVALKNADAGDRNDQLSMAVDTNREIGIAVGIVMSRYKLTRDAAFDMLVVASSHTNHKLRDVAAETASTGNVPTWRPKALAP